MLGLVEFPVRSIVVICVEVFDVFWKWFVAGLWCFNLCFLLFGVLGFLYPLVLDVLALLLVAFLLLFAIGLLAVLGLLRLLGEFRDLGSLL